MCRSTTHVRIVHISMLPCLTPDDSSILFFEMQTALVKEAGKAKDAQSVGAVLVIDRSEG